MFTVALISQKGGVGKTTIALGLASVAAEAGHSVAVIDTDPQTNAANWKDRREAENPAVIATQAGRLRQTLDAAQAAGADFVVIDTPGKADGIAVAAARAADLVLVPSAPQIFELETLPGVRDLLRVAGDPLAFVLLNGIHPQATKSAGEAKALAEQFSGMRACPVHICTRDIYATAPVNGISPNEAEPDGKAADELRQLYKFISALIHTEAGHEQDKRIAERA